MDLLSYLSKEGFAAKLNNRGNLVISQDGDNLHMQRSSTKSLLTRAYSDYVINHDKDNIAASLKLEPDDVVKKIRKVFREDIEAKVKARADLRAKHLGRMPTVHVPPEDIAIFRSVDNTGDPILWNISKKKIHNVHYKTYEATYKTLQVKNVQVPYGIAGHYTTTWNTTPGAQKIYSDNNGEVYVINMYESPSWVKKFEDERANARMPEVIAKFLNHMFLENQATIDRVLDWFAAAMFEKDPLMLCLVSPAQGTGKSLLVDVFGGLHAEGKYFKPSPDVFTGVFNHSLFNKSLVLIEELKAGTGEAKMNIKRIVGNDGIVTRKMHSDQGSKINHPLSLICTTNNYADVGIDGDGRRFFIPNITSVKLGDALGHEAINELEALKFAFHKDKGSEEAQRTMAQLGWFLYERYRQKGVEETSELERIKPENFWTCQRACMPAWKRGVLDMFLDGHYNSDNTFTLEDLRDELVHSQNIKITPNVETIRDFITSHVWKGVTLADIDQKKPLKNSRVIPNIDSETTFDKTPYDNEEDVL